jgi:hypothetical protein
MFGGLEIIEGHFKQIFLRASPHGYWTTVSLLCGKQSGKACYIQLPTDSSQQIGIIVGIIMINRYYYDQRS